MICKHCGYDVPKDIAYCTNCGEPMPKSKEEAEPQDEAKATENQPLLTKKEFAKAYIPHSAKLCIHTGAIMSYFYTVLYLFSLFGVVWLDKATKADIFLLVITVLLGLLTFGFHIKKSTVCAVAITIVAVVFSIFCLVNYGELTVIWICAGFLGCYGTFRYNKIWNTYQKTGKRPKKID